MEHIEGFFPATAMPDRDWWVALWPNPEGTMRDLGVRPGMVVLDLCCGDGYFTAALARIVQGQVYGVDIDPNMLNHTRTELDRTGTTVLGLHCADARNLEGLLPGKMDFVLVANTFHGVTNPTTMARKVAQVLKPQGQLAIVNWYPMARERTVVLGQPRGPKTEIRMAPEKLQSLVEPVGFELEKIIELPLYHYGAVFRNAAFSRV